MKYAIFFTLAILAIASAERHAIIIAPRANWPDYGVQSESCRMYKDLVAGGVKPENIVLMSTKKVSDMQKNPFPGELFTDDSPSAPGKDYAHGCVEYIDYEENDMSAKVMLAIMRADVDALKELTGKENPKVLHSTADDDIMLYFTSHGGPGRILVGSTTVSDKELMETIQYMHDHKMYKNFLFLMEACYSGSMFLDLPKDLNVYAITAADDDHSSYESHCPPNDVIDGKSLGTCLSCYWDNSMEWFMEGGADHTLDELFKHTHEAVAKSSSQNVSHFGDIEGMGKMTLRQFMGDLPAKRLRSMAEDKSEKISKSEVPKHLAMWRAIRADKSELAEAMKEYEEEVFKMAKKEVEVMRLGRAVMSEKAAEKAMKMPAGKILD
ncbi:cysteine protease 13 [Blastocystis sp. ATCC 50177/Nand II]|uniref:Cysteine protease 13 n=1 Tax=Blastocystis sp. subtype 1 (strain ATCC 50177 / NandII) TaxID=478820 RepID=A0A196SI78_BLAHN|nr:cysteine protease 13 [Blastocystis sp. ATCC 50177/Nand II]